MSLTKPSCFKNRNPFSSNSAYDTITYGLLKARLLESEKRHKCELITLLTPMHFYLLSPSTFTYLVTDRIGKLFSLDHVAWYFCLWLWLGLHCLSKPPKKTSWDFFEHWHTRRIYSCNFFFLFFAMSNYKILINIHYFFLVLTMCMLYSGMFQQTNFFLHLIHRWEKGQKQVV